MNQSGKEEFQDNNFTFQKRSQSRWNQERSLCQGVHLQREKWEKGKGKREKWLQ